MVSGQSNGSSSAVRQLISRGFGERARRIVRGIPETENRYRIWPFSPSRSFPLDADLINNGSAPDPLPPSSFHLFSAQPLLGYNTLNNTQGSTKSRSPAALSLPLSFSLSVRFKLKRSKQRRGAERAREIKQPAISRPDYTPPHKGSFTPD